MGVRWHKLVRFAQIPDQFKVDLDTKNDLNSNLDISNCALAMSKNIKGQHFYS